VPVHHHRPASQFLHAQLKGKARPRGRLLKQHQQVAAGQGGCITLGVSLHVQRPFQDSPDCLRGHFFQGEYILHRVTYFSQLWCIIIHRPGKASNGRKALSGGAAHWSMETSLNYKATGKLAYPNKRKSTISPAGRLPRSRGTTTSPSACTRDDSCPDPPGTGWATSSPPATASRTRA